MGMVGGEAARGLGDCLEASPVGGYCSSRTHCSREGLGDPIRAAAGHGSSNGRRMERRGGIKSQFARVEGHAHFLR